MDSSINLFVENPYEEHIGQQLPRKEKKKKTNKHKLNATDAIALTLPNKQRADENSRRRSPHQDLVTFL